jgi:hypothetical protein
MDKEERVKRTVYRNGEPVTEEDEEDDEEIYSCTLPTDMMDMSVYFVDAMTVLAANNPELTQALQSSLNADDRSRLQDIMGRVAERKSKNNL